MAPPALQPTGTNFREISCIGSVDRWLLENLFYPNPHVQGKHMNKTMAAKLPNLPCFQAFWGHISSRFLLIFLLIFLPCIGGGGGAGVTRVFLSCRLAPPSSEPRNWGRQEGVTLICSDFPILSLVVPICDPCFRECPDLFRLGEDFFQRIAKGAGGKGPRQKTSKSVKKFFETFRQFLRSAKKKNVENRQKASKGFSTLFDNFRAAPFYRPLLGGCEGKSHFVPISSDLFSEQTRTNQGNPF